ncbi:MAG: glycosyltransferase, partial [Planctomycetota bacterium]|nr:glycosyltransferase [Planctomycetota bacterium]
MSRNSNSSTLRLPFDQYQRYAFAAAIIGAWRGRKKGLRLLEVGASDRGILEKFLPDDFIVHVDSETPRSNADSRRLVKCDATQVSFLKGAVDVSVSLDALEHVPVDHRDAFLDEMMRVSSTGIVIGAPFDSPEVVAEQTRLNALFRDVRGNDHPWLVEHPPGVLPNLEETVQKLKSAGWHVQIWPHGNLRLWARLMRTTLGDCNAEIESLRATADEIYNTAVYAGDWVGPVYRHFVVAAPRARSIERLRKCFDMERTPGPDPMSRLEEILGRVESISDEIASGKPMKEVLAQQKESPELLDELRLQREALEELGEAQERAALSADIREMSQKQEAALEELREDLENVSQRLEQVAGITSELLGSMRSRRRTYFPGWMSILKTRLSWLFRSRLHRMHPEPVSQLVREGKQFRSTGGDPQFDLHSSRGRLPSGWVTISYGAECDEGRLEPTLYIDSGHGLSEVDRPILPPLRTGRSKTFVHLPDQVHRLRLDPMDCPGRFRLGKIKIRELGQIPLAFLLSWETASGLRFHPMKIMRLAFRGLRVARRDGFSTFKHWMLREAKTSRRSRLSDYDRWMEAHDELSNADRMRIREHIKRLAPKPLISVLLPAAGATRRECRRTLESVSRQLYPNWELCVTGASARVRSVVEEHRREDGRVRVTSHPEGEFVARVEAGDVLAEHALYMVAVEIGSHPDAGLIYSDEDRIDSRGRRDDPYFKPDWNPDLLRSHSYVDHLMVYRADLAENSGVEASALQISQGLPSSRIRHIPHILYHAQSGASGGGSAPRNLEDSRNGEGIAARTGPGQILDDSSRLSLPEPPPRVSLVMIAEGSNEQLRRSVETILQKTRYPSYDLILVSQGRIDSHTEKVLEEFSRQENLTVIRYEKESDREFNRSAMRNHAVGEYRGELIGFVGSGIEIKSPDWLREMVVHALRPEIGAVGAKIYNADGSIWHAGVILGMGPHGVAGNACEGQPGDFAGPQGQATLVQDFSAVSGMCLVLRREVFESVGGLDETRFPERLGDIDLCLRIGEKGRRVVWTPHAEVVRHPWLDELGTERRSRLQASIDFMKVRWRDLLVDDPAYNPNLDLETESFTLASPPRTRKPWSGEIVSIDSDGRRLDPYDAWITVNAWTDRRERLLREDLARVTDPPLVSVLMPVYNTPPGMLDRAIRSVVRQIYPHWELCVADDASTDPKVLSTLHRWAAKDSRIRIVERTENGHISAATNSAARLARGELLVFLDHDDELTVDALARVVLYCSEHPEADLVYSDDDKVDMDGRRYDPQFK